MSKNLIYVLGLTFILALSLSVWAAPGRIDYQGYLEDAGSPVTATLDMKFFIHRTSGTADDSVWSESQSDVVILGGLFNVTLGSSTTIPDTVFNGDTRYLEIEVDGTTLSPRTQIVSSAYSMRVNTVDGADGGTITGDLTVYLGTVKGLKGNFGSGNSVSGANAFASGNQCEASGNESSVCGGRSNIASGRQSTVGGGTYDTASGWWSTVSGGHTNRAHGDYSAVVGGRGSIADGDDSFVAGCRGRAMHDGTIVLSANSTVTVTDTISTAGVEQLVMRADSGIYITNAGGQAAYVTNRLINTSSGAYLTTGGTWTNSSDRNLKENFSPVSGAEILRKVSELPVTRWNYKTDGSEIAHIGPVSQDFHAAFGLGDNDKAIATVDADGIALAAIQELYRITQELQAKSARLEAVEVELANLQTQVTVLLAERDKSSSGGKTLTALNDQSR